MPFQRNRRERHTRTYPARCGKTMDFPRFALSDGTRLFIADGGNDRVLIYNNIPTQNGAAADVILGQPDENASVVSSITDLFHPLLRQSAADITPTPTGLAWDGTNLYVTDPANRRVLVFTPASAADSHQRDSQLRQPADFRARFRHARRNHHGGDDSVKVTIRQCGTAHETTPWSRTTRWPRP